jgi:hypothetical protein
MGALWLAPAIDHEIDAGSDPDLAKRAAYVPLSSVTGTEVPFVSVKLTSVALLGSRPDT